MASAPTTIFCSSLGALVPLIISFNFSEEISCSGIS